MTNRVWNVRVRLTDMRSRGEPFVCHSEFSLQVPGKDPDQAAESLRRVLQRLLDKQSKNCSWSAASKIGDAE